MNTWTHICVKNYLKFIWCVLWRLVWPASHLLTWTGRVLWAVVFSIEGSKQAKMVANHMTDHSWFMAGKKRDADTAVCKQLAVHWFYWTVKYRLQSSSRGTRRKKNHHNQVWRHTSAPGLQPDQDQDQCSADPFTPDPSSKNHAFNFLQHNVCIHRLFIIEALLDWFLFNHLSDNRTYRSATFSITKNTDRPHPPVGGGAWRETQVASYCTSNELAPLPRSLMSPPTVWGLLIRHPLQQEDHGRPVCPPPRPETTSCASK